MQKGEKGHAEKAIEFQSIPNIQIANMIYQTRVLVELFSYLLTVLGK